MAAGAVHDAYYFMTRLRWSISNMLVLTALISVSLVILRTTPQPSNCGGNSAALGAVKTYAILVKLANEQPGEARLTVATATKWQRADLDYIARAHPYARFRVSPESFASQQSGPRHVIMVCDRAFTNVPRYKFGEAPPTHAAAFSDGTTGLISVAEFQKLGRASLVSLDRLLAADAPHLQPLTSELQP